MKTKLGQHGTDEFISLNGLADMENGCYPISFIRSATSLPADFMKYLLKFRSGSQHHVGKTYRLESFLAVDEIIDWIDGCKWAERKAKETFADVYEEAVKGISEIMQEAQKHEWEMNVEMPPEFDQFKVRVKSVLAEMAK